MFRYTITILLIILFREAFELGFHNTTIAASFLNFVYRKYTLGFFSTIGLITFPLITSLVIDSILGRRFLILNMLFGRNKDEKGGIDWEAFQALNWICSAIFMLSMTHLLSSGDLRSFRQITNSNENRLALVLAFLSITYLFGFFGVSLAAHDIARTTSRDKASSGLTSYVPPMYYLGVVAFVWYLDTSLVVRSLVTISTMLFFAALHLSKQISLSAAENQNSISSPKRSAGISSIDVASTVRKPGSSLFKSYDVDVANRNAQWYRQLKYDLFVYIVPMAVVGSAAPILRPLIYFIVFALTFFLPVYQKVCEVLYFKPSPPENPQVAADRLVSYPHKYVNGWFRVMGASDLAAGQVKYIVANGRHLAVFRGDTDNTVKCVDAHCIHLGANMAIGGKVINNCLQCPFHKWSFDGNGTCTDIPYCDPIPAATKTRAYYVCQYYEEIIVWIHSEDIAPTYYPPNIPRIDAGGMIQKGFLTTTVNMHINEFAENSTDFTHFDPLHGQMVLPLTPIQIPGLTVNHRPDWKDGQGDQSHMAWFFDKADLSFCGMKIPESGADACITFVGPAGIVFFTFETPIGSIVLFQLHTPLDPLKLETSFRWYADSTMPRLLVWYVVGMWLAQWRNDIFVWENKRFAGKPVLVKGDGPMQKQRRWFRQFYPATPAPGTASASAIASAQPSSSSVPAADKASGPNAASPKTTDW